MSIHERILHELNHEEPDRVPTFCQTIERPLMKKNDNAGIIEDDLFDLLFPSLKMDPIFAKAIGFDLKCIFPL
ncbi:MAG: hypothetical protein ACTSVI_16745 [Promethearchaeota archaeon]